MPDDTSPHGGEAMHPLPDRAKIPKDRPGASDSLRERGDEISRAEIERRPALPDDSEPLAADIEDEDDDPVVESGPGVAEDTGKPSVVKQPGG